MLFSLTFFLCRMIPLASGTYRLYANAEDTSHVARPVMFLLYFSFIIGGALNIYWMYKIVQVGIDSSYYPCDCVLTGRQGLYKLIFAGKSKKAEKKSE